MPLRVVDDDDDDDDGFLKPKSTCASCKAASRAGCKFFGLWALIVWASKGPNDLTTSRNRERGLDVDRCTFLPNLTWKGPEGSISWSQVSPFKWLLALKHPLAVWSLETCHGRASFCKQSQRNPSCLEEERARCYFCRFRGQSIWFWTLWRARPQNLWGLWVRRLHNHHCSHRTLLLSPRHFYLQSGMLLSRSSSRIFGISMEVYWALWLLEASIQRTLKLPYSSFHFSWHLNISINLKVNYPSLL